MPSLTLKDALGVQQVLTEHDAVVSADLRRHVHLLDQDLDLVVSVMHRCMHTGSIEHYYVMANASDEMPYLLCMNKYATFRATFKSLCSAADVLVRQATRHAGDSNMC